MLLLFINLIVIVGIVVICWKNRAKIQRYLFNESKLSVIMLLQLFILVFILVADGEPKRSLTCDKGHLLTIETEFVSSALKEFVERYEFVKKEVSPDKKVIKEKVTISRNITDDDITDFWERYRNIFPKDKERLWDNLLIGLKKYYEVLKERHQLNAETQSLRKQNAEMRRLLSKYTTQVMLK